MSMGAIKPELPLLPRVQDRMTFLYLEMCELSRSDSNPRVCGGDPDDDFDDLLKPL